MIKIYISPSCSSCRKVIAWFDKEGIPYEAINILRDPITEEDLKDILNKSEEGTDEIISTRSKVFKEQSVDLDAMSVKELCAFILANPTILKRPIIVDDEKIQVGYNADELEIFERQKKQIHQAKKLASEICTQDHCPEYCNCQHRFNDRRTK